MESILSKLFHPTTTSTLGNSSNLSSTPSFPINILYLKWRSVPRGSLIWVLCRNIVQALVVPPTTQLHLIPSPHAFIFLLWRELMLEVRKFCSRGEELPMVATPTNLDFRHALIHQKLEFINYCLLRRANDSSTNHANSLHSSASKPENLLDTSATQSENILHFSSTKSHQPPKLDIATPTEEINEPSVNSQARLFHSISEIADRGFVGIFDRLMKDGVEGVTSSALSNDDFDPKLSDPEPFPSKEHADTSVGNSSHNSDSDEFFDTQEHLDSDLASISEAQSELLRTHFSPATISIPECQDPGNFRRIV